MAGFESHLGRFTNTARLFKLVSGMSEEKQFILFKTLLRQDVANYLFQLIIEMSEDQQTQLLSQLTQMSFDVMPAKTISLDDYESSMRENPRKPCLIKVIGVVQDQTFKSYIVDISMVGVFIETSADYAVGQSIKLAFALPDQKDPIKLTGKIAWKGLQGIGVKFVKLSDHHKKIIQAFVNRR